MQVFLWVCSIILMNIWFDDASVNALRFIFIILVL